jgi:mono/diheme cytochrome c family protein
MRTWIVVVAMVGAAIAAFYAATWPRPIPPAHRLPRNGFDPALISRGAELAAIGNCDGCHTARSSARLAGGRAIATPFGTIYSTNITPDEDTGLGLWSEDAFQRAMHDGISRDGHYLYPAFPYDHFTEVTAQDNHALYAYLMSQPPLRTVPETDSLWFPLKSRRLIAVWNWLFLKKGVQSADRRQTPEWNRGAYLVNGLGHCGACHTPRNLLGAERERYPLAGGRADGWDAWALNRDSPAPVAWTVPALSFFLQTGWHSQHGVAHGPMAVVTDGLGRAQQADLRAMSVYIHSKMDAHREAERPVRQEAQPGNGRRGADIFAASCASCHAGDESPPFGGIDLAFSSALDAPDPRNAIWLVLAGVPAQDGSASGMMPGFDGAMSDQDLALLLEYLRARFSDKTGWNALAKNIQAARRDLKMCGQP